MENVLEDVYYIVLSIVSIIHMIHEMTLYQISSTVNGGHIWNTHTHVYVQQNKRREKETFEVWILEFGENTRVRIRQGKLDGTPLAFVIGVRVFPLSRFSMSPPPFHPFLRTILKFSSCVSLLLLLFPLSMFHAVNALDAFGLIFELQPTERENS